MVQPPWKMSGRLAAALGRSGKKKDGKTGTQSFVRPIVDLLWKCHAKYIENNNFLFSPINDIFLSAATIPIRDAITQKALPS